MCALSPVSLTAQWKRKRKEAALWAVTGSIVEWQLI